MEVLFFEGFVECFCFGCYCWDFGEGLEMVNVWFIVDEILNKMVQVGVGVVQVEIGVGVVYCGVYFQMVVDQVVVLEQGGDFGVVVVGDFFWVEIV